MPDHWGISANVEEDCHGRFSSSSSFDDDSLASVLGGVAALIAGLWVVASFAISGVRDDVSSIRQSLIQTSATIQQVEREGQTQILEMNKEMLVLNKDDLNKTYGDLKIVLVKLVFNLN